MTLIWICSAWLLGIFAADQAGLPALPLGIVAGTACLLALLWRRSAMALPLVLLAASGLGGVRAAAARPADDQAAVWRHLGKRMSVTGAVVKPPVWHDDGQTIVIDAIAVAEDGVVQPVHGLVQVHLPPVPMIEYGQQIVATGRLEQPRTGALFDYRAYLARHSVYAVMNFPRVAVRGQDPRLAPLSALMQLNTRLRATLQRLLPEPHAGLLAGMLLGTRAAIPEPVLADFSATGTSHLLVISGWNISVLIGAVVGGATAAGVPRRRAAVLALPILPMYVLFVGASPSVIRAGLMGALVLWAAIADREADAWTGLALACALLALLDPNV
ncbi:MAG TPA: ComEC/Rec2 family competence protein, partial [Herpetosiphonaceae bacterium]|nr:ComEC/Rec2 family competence protein [Herpetosiphonaceae bacterium]